MKNHRSKGTRVKNPEKEQLRELVKQMEAECGVVSLTEIVGGRPAQAEQRLQGKLDKFQSLSDKLKIVALAVGKKDGRMPSLADAVGAGVFDYTTLKSLYQYEHRNLKATNNSREGFKINASDTKVKGEVERAILKELEKKQGKLRTLAKKIHEAAANVGPKGLSQDFIERCNIAIKRAKLSQNALSSSIKQAKEGSIAVEKEACVISRVVRAEKEAIKMESRGGIGQAIALENGKLIHGTSRCMKAANPAEYKKNYSLSMSLKNKANRGVFNANRVASMISQAMLNIGGRASKKVEGLLAKLTSKGKGADKGMGK